MIDVISVLTLIFLTFYILGKFAKYIIAVGLLACVAYSVTNWSYQLHSMYFV
jgi:hypothetical protein